MREVDWESVEHFDPREFTRPDLMQPALLHALDKARGMAGMPFVLSSTFREGDDGAHGRGWAVDIGASLSRQRFYMVRALIDAGFHRIGVYDLHIHADMDPSLDPEVLWVGESQ